MTSNLQHYLQNYINRILDDTRNPRIPKKAIFTNDVAHNNEALAILKVWEENGILEISPDPINLGADEICVTMKKYINSKSPIPGFLNWED